MCRSTNLLGSPYVPCRGTAATQRAIASGATPRSTGFTLLEIMIAVAIVAILTAIALPIYTNNVVRANRAAAERFMLDIANREEQWMLDQRAYTATLGSGGLGLTAEADLLTRYQFPDVALTGNDCAGVALVGPSFVIRATAIGAQAPDGNLCLDSRNNRTPADKWQR